MQRNIRPDNNNSTALFVIFDIISRIIFIYASIVLLYWLFTIFILPMGFRFPYFVSAFCEAPYGLAYMVGYTHHSGINFAGGIAAIILYVIGYVIELIRNAIIVRR